MVQRLFPMLCLAAALLAQAPAHAPVRTGIDVLAAGDGAALRGQRLGLVTNHTGRTSDGRRTVDVLARLAGKELVALFSPEHGWDGVLDEKVADARDAATGLRVYSLYGETRKPTAAMLAGLDTLVFDIQDIGCRFYTYVSTMALALEAAAEHKLRFCVLDRPNPLGGVLMEGPLPPQDRLDFIGCHTVPLRHGLTTGELARMLVGERGLVVELQVIAAEGWQRSETWDRTGLPWIDPSPNMRSLVQAMLYPGIGLLEGTNLSVGRGTDQPFERLGAPWCDGVRLASALRAAAIPGVAFVPIRFTPKASKHSGKECGGVQIAITDWATFRPVATGVHIACALRDLHGADWQHDKLDWLLKHPPSIERFLGGAARAAIVDGWKADLDLFRMRRKPFLIYP